VIIFGLDFSHYDQVPDGARVVSEGFSFMTHKAGGDKDDPELAAWWKAMKPHRGEVLLGAYWVLYPGNPVGRADAFLARLDSQCPGWRDGPFILQVDCEIWNGDTSTKPGKADIKSFCDRLKAKMPKLRPIVYASSGQYGNSLNGLGYPLWNARYPSSSAGAAATIYEHVGGDSGSGWSSYSGQVPAIWQFTSSATIAGQTTCDANAYRGTLAALTNLLAPGWEVDDVELNDKYGDQAWPARTLQDRLKDDAKLRDVLWGDSKGTQAAELSPASPLAKLIGVPSQLAQLADAVAQLSSGQPATAQTLNAQTLNAQTSDARTLSAPADLNALADKTPEEIADVLKSVLGDKAGPVAAALQS
jgi:GH25 family lysozyme M1 (1,4-beta-N-acetylmuramidase)